MVAVLAVLLTGLAAQVAGPVPVATAAGGGTVDLTGLPAATFTVAPGVEQVTVTGAAPRTPLTLVAAATLERLVTLYSDDRGQLSFQYVPDDFLIADPQTQGILPTTKGGTVTPGQYRIVAETVTDGAISATLATSPAFSVLSIDDHPDPSTYDQVLPSVPASVTGAVKPGHTDAEGYGYLETRDGTLLSVNVRLPDSDLYGPGPYPTVIQYSGYAPSRPGAPSGSDAGGFLAATLGFAYVGVNVRGSGCSGGVIDVFNAAQAADGYDVVETVARQPWVKNHRPAMMGISYSGITQLYVAATRPPSLAAITPLSVIEDPWDQQWPGGIYNTGFTQSWLASLDDEAAGQAAWVRRRIADGDTTCADNLELRSQSIPFEALGRSLERRPPSADARNLSQLVRKIQVPVFLTGAWQDEQTGSRFSVLLDDFTSVPNGQRRFTMFNGHHPDGYTPLVLTRWFEFLSFYVDRTIPYVNDLVRTYAGPTLEDQFGVAGLGFEPNRFFEFATKTPKYGTFEASLAAYEQEQPVRVLFEVGASPDFLPAHPGAQRQRFAMTFPAWPPADASARTFYLGAGGTLATDAPAAGGVDRFAFDPDVLDTRYFVSGDWIKPQVTTSWKPTADGKGLSYVTPPLTGEMIVAGEGYLDLWVRSTGTDAPLEVVLSEVYEDADPTDAVPPEEVRVQTGLLRAGYRTLDPDRSTAFLKEHRFSEQDYQPLTPGEFVNVQIPLFAVAHPFRPGSRLRVQINTPGGDDPLWSFESDDYGITTEDVARGGAMASRLVLPVLPSSNPFRRLPAAFDEQSERPPCGSLRGQPCRPYVPLANQEVVTQPPDSIGSAPAASAPTATSVTVTSGQSGGADGVTGYRFYLYAGSSSTPAQTKDSSAATRQVTFTGLTPGQRYRFRSVAFNAGGLGEPSPVGAYVLPPFLDLSSFTTRQHLDFAGRNPTASELADWSTRLGAGTRSAQQLVNDAVDFNHHQAQSGVIRLYRAYFLRTPDKSGLDHWTGRLRSGTSLGQISQSFAASSEFTRRYGSLDNRAFVNLVYTNVLGRAGDSAGVSYWTAQLDQRKKSRGQVMIGFSESSENRRKTQPLVDTVNVFTGMLRRVPTSAETASWAPASGAPSRLALVTEIFASAEYDARV